MEYLLNTRYQGQSRRYLYFTSTTIHKFQHEKFIFNPTQGYIIEIRVGGEITVGLVHNIFSGITFPSHTQSCSPPT